MSRHATPLKVWIVDPINYSGMAYYDAGLAGGLARAGAEVTVAGSDRPLVRPSVSAGWRLLPIFRLTAPEQRRWRRAMSYPVATLRLIRELTRHRPDVMLWNYIEVPSLDTFAMAVARQAGVKLVFIAHEIEPWERSGWRRRIHRWAVEAASIVVAHGRTNAEALRNAWSLPEDHVMQSEHGDYREWVDVAADQLEARRELGLPEDAPIALFFGTLRMSKGLRTLIDAWPGVRRHVPNAELLISGRPYRGTDPAVLQGLPDGITLHIGSSSPATANHYYAAADVVAIPYDKVSTSGVMRYAYSAARPVIATSIGELADHVMDGKTGRLVPPGDTEATASALIDVLSDRARASEMGSQARAYALQEFSWDVIGARLLRELRSSVVGRR